MSDLPEDIFANPVWHALHTAHRSFSICEGDACRYPADVAPFAAVAEPRAACLEQLRSLLEPGERIWLTGDSFPAVAGLCFEATLPCLQMVLGETAIVQAATTEIATITDSADMVELTDLAYPGFFRRRTCEMGTYYGVRDGGKLIAMGGERLRLDGYPEISGVCTHPSHRGEGLATGIIGQLAGNHRRDGLVSWLQVAVENRRAIELYREIGFRTVTLHRVTRVNLGGR